MTTRKKPVKKARKTGATRMKKPSDFELFTMVNDTVAAEYWEDTVKAGVVTSKIQAEPPLYYAAIARYHNHHTNKQIIASAKASSLRQAIQDVAKNWMAIVSPPPVEDLKQKLKGVL